MGRRASRGPPAADVPFLFQTVAFCELFELIVEESSVRFDRVNTESVNLEGKSMAVTKSQHLVLAKNTRSLGEVSACVCVIPYQTNYSLLPGCQWWAPPPSLHPHPSLQLCTWIGSSNNSSCRRAGQGISPQ